MSEPRNGQERDRELGELLRTHLSAPPLRSGFHEELEARLATIPSSAIAAPRRRHMRRSTRRLLALVAVAAAASVVAFAVLPLLQRDSTATAADMLAAMTSAGRRSQTVALDIVITSRNGVLAFTSDGRVRLVLDTAGDVLATRREVQTWGGENPGRSEGESASGYDAGLHEARSRSGRPGSKQTTHVHRPAWQADLGVDPDSLDEYSYDTLAASFRAKLAELDPATPVRESTYLGRPVWVAELTEKWPANSDRKVDIFVYWDITVDKATGLLLAAQPRLEAGGEVAEVEMSLRVVRIQTDPQLPEGWQLPPLPEGAQGRRHRRGDAVRDARGGRRAVLADVAAHPRARAAGVRPHRRGQRRVRQQLGIWEVVAATGLRGHPSLRPLRLSALDPADMDRARPVPARLQQLRGRGVAEAVR